MQSALTRLDLTAIRAEFPVLDQEVHGRKLAYLDNAASVQKPLCVIETIRDYYLHHHANVHRGVHALSQLASDRFDESRAKLARFLGAESPDEIIFTKGSTEAINLVANAWGRANLKSGDRILLTTMEHHANIVPWQVIAEQTGAEIVPIPITDAGEVDLAAYRALLDERVKMVGVVHVSNSLGTINPIGEMTALAHAVGARVMIDGAQATAHMRVDLRALDIDFYSLAGHKMYGPTGIGALYGKRELLEAMPPYQTGGGMIRSVSFEKTTYAALPDKFEPGTPNIEGAIALGAAVDYLNAPAPGRPEMTLLEAAAEHEHELTFYAHDQLSQVPGVALHGTAHEKSGILSFTMAQAHPHDIGTILDQNGVAIRAGHHCCQPLMKRLGVPATARASFAVYNTHDEVDQLADAVRQVGEIFG
jgi:cysteine desulfurase / selenocysteine lyase